MTVHFQRPAAQRTYDLRMTPVPVAVNYYPHFERCQLSHLGLIRSNSAECAYEKKPTQRTMASRPLGLELLNQDGLEAKGISLFQSKVLRFPEFQVHVDV